MCKLLYKPPIPMSCLLHGERTEKAVISEGTYNQLPRLLPKYQLTCSSLGSPVWFFASRELYAGMRTLCFSFFYLHVCCMQSAPRRRSYQRTPTIRCSSCCRSCPPPAAMSLSCSQSPLSSQVLPFTLPKQCPSQSHVLPFMMSRQCLLQLPRTAFHDVQAMPFTTPTYCLSNFPGNACHDTQGLPFIVSMLPFTVSMSPFIALACLPLSCLLPLSRPHWRVLPYTCSPHLHAHT